jgi:hypothetical protein
MPDGARWTAIGTARQRKLLVVVLVAAAALRFAWAIDQAHAPLRGDPLSYFIMALGFAHGHGYPSSTVEFANLARSRAGVRPLPVPPSAYFPPGYPAVLGALYWAMLHSPIPHDGDALPAAGRMLNALFSTGVVGLTFLIARRIVSCTAALVATALVALTPSLIFASGTLHVEPFATLAVLLVVYLAVRVAWSTRGLPWRALAAIAVVAGAAALVRPTSLAPLVGIAAGIAAARTPTRRLVAQLGWVLLLAALVIVPWTVRNAVQLHAFVPVSTGIADAMCMSRNPDATGRYMVTSYCEPSDRGVAVSRYEVLRYHHNEHQAWQWVVHHPAGEVGQWFTRTYWAFREDHDLLEAGFGTTAYRVVGDAADAFFLALLVAAAFGARRFARRVRPRRVMLLATAAVLLCVPALLHGEPRFKVPAEPLLAIIAAPALVAAGRACWTNGPAGWCRRGFSRPEARPRTVARAGAPPAHRQESLGT